MRVAYATTYAADDITQWSGLGYYIAQSLRHAPLHVDLIGPLYDIYPWVWKLKKAFYRYGRRQNYYRDRELALVGSYGRQLAQRLDGKATDVVFSPSSIPIALLETKQPIIIWTDATFAGVVDFYPGFSQLCRETLVNGNALEQAALTRCRLAIYSSDWAAQTAIRHYHIDPSKVRVVPYGANIESSFTAEEIRDMVGQRPTDSCNLLFLGVDWLRKGGDVALQVAQELNRQGLPTKLHIVGCVPPGRLPNWVIVHGFVSKARPEGRRLINQLLAEAHFLILPTRADCVPVALAEANAFAVPVLTSDVGGITTVVREGLNGQAFAVEASSDAYCAFIWNCMSRDGAYQQLALSAFAEYQSRLNWMVAGQRVRDLLQEVCQ